MINHLGFKVQSSPEPFPLNKRCVTKTVGAERIQSEGVVLPNLFFLSTTIETLTHLF